MEPYVIQMQHDAGFFSVCTVNLRTIIGHYNNTRVLCEIDSSKQWNHYKDVDGDVVSRYFTKKDTTTNHEPSHFTTSSDEDQFSDYSLINYDYVNFFVDKYFSPSQEVLDIKKTFMEKYQIDVTKTISVCYRGNDKSRETNLPSYDEMMSKIDEVKNNYPEFKLLIQSDEIEFCNFVLSKYPDSIVIDEVKRINKTPTAIQYTIPQGIRVINAQNFLASALIVSECSHLILNSGNVGMWLCLFRKNSNNVYQYLNPKDSNNPIGWIK